MSAIIVARTVRRVWRPGGGFFLVCFYYCTTAFRNRCPKILLTKKMVKVWQALYSLGRKNTKLGSRRPPFLENMKVNFKNFQNLNANISALGGFGGKFAVIKSFVVAMRDKRCDHNFCISTFIRMRSSASDQ